MIIKKKLFTKLLIFAFMIPVSMLFVACGNQTGDASKKISRFEFQDPFVTITYGDSLEHDPFGTKLVFQDGSQKSIDDVTADEAKEWGLTTRMTKFNEQTQQEEEWDLSQRFTVGSYSVYYSAPNANNQASLQVQKADYAGNVSVSMTSSMQYGGALAEPTLQFSSDTVTYVQFYYQSATDDGSYREDNPGDFDWGAYDYTADATCNLMPGNYQIYARFETENYNQKRTTLKNFVVSKNNVDKTYALFGEISVYDPDTETYSWQLMPLDFNTPFEMEYFYNKSQKLSDYISYMNQVYVYEVDEHGDIMTDDQGQQVQGQSLAWCYASDVSTITLASSDIDINGAGTYNVVLRYSPDVSVYNPVTLTFKLKVNKLRFELSREIGVWVSDIETRVGDIEYDGQDHHIVVNGINNVKEFGGVYYACVSYDEGTDHAYDLKVFTVSNYQRRNAGTYSVVCEVPSNLTDCVELAWYDDEEQLQVGSIVNLGSWTIGKKSYQIEADVLFNGVNVDEYVYNDCMTLTYGSDYVVDVQNIVAKYAGVVDSSVHPTLASISAWVQDELGNWTVPATGVTIDNDTHTITIENDCPHEMIEWHIDFAIDNTNYEAQCISDYAYLKQAVNYRAIDGRILNEDRYNSWTFAYEEVYNKSNGRYVSADGKTFVAWADAYNTLYYEDVYGQKVKNTSNVIDNGKTYYFEDNGNYILARFYVEGAQENTSAHQIGNTVGYDAKAKVVDATISLQLNNVHEWSLYYNELYVYYNDQYILNDSADIDWHRSYFKKVGEEYVSMYFYYMVDGAYIYVTDEVDGVTDYYVAEGYHYLTTTRVENWNGSEWVETNEARDVGQYRTVFRLDWTGNRVLVDPITGRYLTELYYEWEIVDNLTKTKVVVCEPYFEDIHGNALTVGTNNTIEVNAADIPAVLKLNVTLKTPSGQDIGTHYDYVFATTRDGNPGSTSYYGKDGYQAYDTDTYHTRVYFVFEDGEHCLTDANGSVVEYIEITWHLTVHA